MQGIVNSFKNLNTSHKYYCEECNDTGKIEVMKYVGTKDLQYVKPDQEVIGYDRIFRMCWNYLRSINPRIPEMGKVNWEDKESIEAYCKTVEKFDPFQYLRVLKVDPCTCARGNWIKEKKENY